MKQLQQGICWGLFLLLPFQLWSQDTLIQAGATWRYYDQGNKPMGNWTGIIYPDSTWATGAAQLGYGDGDEATVVGAVNTVYFRKSFMVNNPSQYRALLLELLRDDGAVVYLNGMEVWRENIDPNTTLSYNTFANTTVSGADEDAWVLRQVSNNLVAGKNTIAVEMHQRSLLSSDVSFDFQFIVDTVKRDTILRGPYLQNATSSSVVVQWRTADLSHSKVRYGTDLNNLQLLAQDTFNYRRDHALTITGLLPATRYYYTIENEEKVLTTADSGFYFQTNPVVGQAVPTTIWALGDCGTANANQRAVRDAYYQYIGQQHTNVLLFLGDNAYDDGTDGEYQKALFENMYEDMLCKTTAWSCIGNHDAHSANASSQSGPYFDIFSFPTQGEAGGIASGTEAYYSFDYGNIHFIILDSNNPTNLNVGGTMYNWCQADLQNTTADWIIAVWHHPAYTKGSHDSDLEPQLIQMRSNFLPLLESNGVDLVLCGHSHSYERSYFINGHYSFSFTYNPLIHTVGTNGMGDGNINSAGAYQKTWGASAGAVYITAGSSGKKSGGSLNHPAMYSSMNELGSCVIEVDGARLDGKFIKENGQVMDYFTILKTGFVSTSGLSEELKIFPNPASERVQLSSTTPLISLQLFNEQGIEVLQLDGNVTDFSVKNLPAGVYIISALTIDKRHLLQLLTVVR